jgi:hypothetical protein
MSFAIVLIALTNLCYGQETLDLPVEHVRALRNTRGALHVDVSGIAFRSDDKKTEIRIPLQNLRHVAVSNPKALHFETFERREYTFRAAADAPVEELARFLAAHTGRPVTGHYAESSVFRIPAYHRHLLGGTHGTLEIGSESIQYVSESPTDSRTWLYRDIETIGRPDAFGFRVTAGKETYVLELQERMPQSAYDLAWNNVYGINQR